MNQDFKKVFKTPKYTGVTLALLSMFVLTSMMVVWDRISEKPESKNSESLEIFCETQLEPIFRPAFQSFYQNTGIGIKVSFLSREEIQASLSKKDKRRAIIFLGENDYNSGEGFQGNFEEKIIIGYQSAKKDKFHEKNPNGKSVYCLVDRVLNQPSDAFALIRFILSPDHGHALLTKEGFVPQPGDKWERIPFLLVYASENQRAWLSHCLKTFSIREGIQVELNIRSEQGIDKAVSLIAKSRAKQYLPDIVIGCPQIQNYSDLFSPPQFINDQKMMAPCYISKTSRYWHSAQRLLNALEKCSSK